MRYLGVLIFFVIASCDLAVKGTSDHQMLLNEKERVPQSKNVSFFQSFLPQKTIASKKPKRRKSNHAVKRSSAAKGKSNKGLGTPSSYNWKMATASGAPTYSPKAERWQYGEHVDTHDLIITISNATDIGILREVEDLCYEKDQFNKVDRIRKHFQKLYYTAV